MILLFFIHMPDNAAANIYFLLSLLYNKDTGMQRVVASAFPTII